ncbi:SCP2 sterol-binding domain-containing protein [Amycolatopsis sp. PS_44_ISF1]|uniref:SCP2 sterol-binding domain-containing protein n=1 Tax=Amycolatopsis sp. PS_44_ISF1 TaxID=2974917 RepID=UPI0028DFFB1A|nr:SCP2 sterol-binding domain-containing protein [Amycolatopsis sp. PS_44_ISF1]MDT8910550.1 SCP2 sterol-binding domain-containing protein [Amycolatopsis sp. PS_44_ISF1]
MLPWRRSSRPPSAAAAAGQELNAFARRLELAKLNPEQFVQVLETLHMLGTAGAGIELSSMSTQVLVDIVGNSSREQLKAIADHPELRAVFLDEIFRRMSEHFLPDRARYVNVVVSWRFPSGEADYDRFQTVIEDGLCVSSTDLSRTPDTTITLSVDDFIRMTTGNATVATMFVTGRVKVKGEYAPAVRLSSYFDIPKPSEGL